MAESSSYLIDDGAKKKTETGSLNCYKIDFNKQYKINDLDLNPLSGFSSRSLKECQEGSSEFFKVERKKHFSTKTDMWSLNEWRGKMESLQGKRYTLTLTWDPKKISDICFNSEKQWQRMRTILWQHSCKYHYKYYMVPELHEENEDKVHAHGIIIFPLNYNGKSRSNYKIMRERSFTMEKFQQQIGVQVQNHRIHDLYQKYDTVGYQGNFQTKKKNATLAKWWDYVHSETPEKQNKEKVYLDMGITSNFNPI